MFTLMRLWKISLIALLASMATAQESSGPCANKKVIVSVVRGAQPFFDLRLENFQAKIGGQPVRIASIASNAKPKRVVLLLDASAFMGNNGGYSSGLEFAQAIAAHVTNDSQFAVYAFKERLQPLLLFSESPRALSDKVSNLPQDWRVGTGRAALWDSIDETIRVLDSPGPNDVILLVSAGGDNSSKAKGQDVNQKLRESGVRLFGILNFSSIDPKATDGLNYLSDLAAGSGGETFFPQDNPSDLKGIVRDAGTIMELLGSGYELELKLPSPIQKSARLSLQLQGVDRDTAKKLRLLYPTKVVADCPRQ